jgi:DNA polymerase I-like protein with 3'-5' exonuclease and polymerase domains
MRYLLKTQNLKPRVPNAIIINATVADLTKWIPMTLAGTLFAVDTETTGLNAHYADEYMVGIGLANADIVIYIDIKSITKEAKDYLRGFLKSIQLTAFNAIFDLAWLQRFCEAELNCISDTYAIFKNLSSEGWPGQRWGLEALQLEVLGWPETNKTVLEEALKEQGLTKATMWQLDTQILGHYCALDTDAAWQAWVYFEKLCKDKYPHYLDYHQRLFINEVQLLIEQQFRGIKPDLDLLEICRSNNEERIKLTMQAFLNHPLVAPHIDSYNRSVMDAWKASEPPQLLKDNVTVSKRWEAWRDREEKYLEDKGFNPNSKTQLSWLFYDKLGNKSHKKTETGRNVVDRKILPSFGEPGKLLVEYNLYLKRRGYIARTIEKSSKDGILHPQFNSVGTMTTRLGGSGGLNFQQLPKTEEFLKALCARPGHKLVQADAVALEPVILAEFSRDKTLWSLYGPEAKSNDIYLYIAAKLPGLRDEVLKYYDPDNPTDEGIALAKKHCKQIRSLAKLVHLSSAYGAGARKIHETLTLAGITISLREVYKIHEAYWRLFVGVKKFGEDLTAMWERDKWIPSILGTPIVIAENLLKDITNRHIQTSGHLVLQVWLYYTNKLRKERGIVATPWICDFHDEMIFEAPNDHAKAMAQAISDALDLTNEELGMDIKIQGPALIANNLAEIKLG